MNPTSNSPELPLPAPNFGPENNAPNKLESNSAEIAPRIGGAPQSSGTVLPLVDPTQLAEPAVHATSSQSSDDQDQAQQAVEDTDVIEKEWVTRAKKIVDSTKDNPAKQSKELSVFKAEYMKKRFNKELKVKEEAADQAQTN